MHTKSHNCVLYVLTSLETAEITIPDTDNSQAPDPPKADRPKDRERWLELLKSRVVKKPRLMSDHRSGQKRRRSSKSQDPDTQGQKNLVPDLIQGNRRHHYQQSSPSGLIQMLESIGINASGLSKEALVESCVAHDDLSKSVPLTCSCSNQEAEAHVPTRGIIS